jgi:hypothetical protein
MSHLLFALLVQFLPDLVQFPLLLLLK